MKKYVVLQRIGTFSAKENRQFDNLDDARAYRNLLNVSKLDNFTKYYIAEVIELQVRSVDESLHSLLIASMTKLRLLIKNGLI